MARTTPSSRHVHARSWRSHFAAAKYSIALMLSIHVLSPYHVLFVAFHLVFFVCLVRPLFFSVCLVRPLFFSVCLFMISPWLANHLCLALPLPQCHWPIRPPNPEVVYPPTTMKTEATPKSCLAIRMITQGQTRRRMKHLGLFSCFRPQFYGEELQIVLKLLFSGNVRPLKFPPNPPSNLHKKFTIVFCREGNL